MPSRKTLDSIKSVVVYFLSFNSIVSKTNRNQACKVTLESCLFRQACAEKKSKIRGTRLEKNNPGEREVNFLHC